MAAEQIQSSATTGVRSIGNDIEHSPGAIALFARLRAGAAERERERRLPNAEIREIADLGLGAGRLPLERGGHGWDTQTFFRYVHALGAADANIAHALRNHYLFTELLLTFPDSTWRSERLRRIADGAILGEAHAERHTGVVGTITTSLKRNGGGYVLDGTKFYSTGSLFADYVWISAKDEDGALRWVDLPADRAGLSFVDDWDGFGQRLTASGTTQMENVRVGADDLSPVNVIDGTSVPRQSVFAQLYMTTIVAGIAENIAADAADLLRKRGRAYQHAAATQPQADPLLLEQVGYLSSYAYVSKTAVEAAAAKLANVGEVFARGGDYGAAGAAASLAAAQAKLVIDEIVLKAASLLFDVGGASATSRDLALDRHWRNARTLSSHNPRVHKARGIGDHVVNGVDLPSAFF